MKVQNIHTATWLSSVPQHWKTLRIKNLFAEIDDRSETGEEELLSVSHYTGVTKKRDSLENEDDFISNAKTLVGYKKVAENDLVSNIMLAWNGSLGISKYDGITSPAYCVYRIKGENNPHYYGYLFSTAIMKAEFRKRSFGIIDSRLRLYSDKFFSIPVAVPAKDEQDQIVNYIKAKSKKIKHFIQKKQAFIELLKEQRQVIISRAVTKGINPDVTLKDSGIEWLGDIPEHWGIQRLKNCGTFQSGENLTSEVIDDTGDYPVYGGNGLRGYYNRYNHDGEFVLIGRQGALCGNINYGSGKFWATEHAVVVTLNERINHFWFGETLRVMNLNQYSQSSAQPGIAVENIRPLKLPFPPLKEQTQIVSFIKAETAKIDQAIAKAEKEIELIKEYREAMIAEAVLGKLDVKVHTKKVLENG
jgi:type I restriction enzyme S subunit